MDKHLKVFGEAERKLVSIRDAMLGRGYFIEIIAHCGFCPKQFTGRNAATRVERHVHKVHKYTWGR